MSRRSAVAALVAGLLAAGGASAERVFVSAADGEQGHGWLFGSAGGGELACWVALPLHVAEIDETGEARPVVFETVGGVGGETGDPIPVAGVAGAMEAAGGVADLAFAPVAAGPRPEDCRSRLGLPAFTYETVLRAVPDLAVFNLLPKSYGPFEATVVSGRSESAGGGLLKLAARDPADGVRHIAKGISGAVAEVRYAAGIHLFAMILEATPEDPPLALALRFDRIRAAFEVVERGGSTGGVVQAGAGIPFRIDGFEGKVEPGGEGPTVLARAGGCWRVSPPDGGAVARLTITVEPAGGAIRGLTLVQSPDCDPVPRKVRIEQRSRSDAGWTMAAECLTSAAPGARPACLLDLRGSRQLRLSIPGPGAIGLSALVVE